MGFSGFAFLLGFLPLTLCGYAIVGRRGPGWAKAWLIAASLAFYALGAPRFVPLLILSVGGNYVLLHLMRGSPRAGAWAAVGVALNLAVLGWFKYLGPDPIPPLGLSFFTFTQIGCLLHYADGETPPPRPADYALFAAFFPALLAGPILNPRELLPQFARVSGWAMTADSLAVGSGFFLIGLLKKTLLADPLSTVVGAGFNDPAHLTLLPAWQAAASYSLMLYFDFSGYSDMAIGLARVVGLHFPDNFDQPYRATSVIAYWQRWHMSLTRLLMANVHTPLTMAVLRWRKRRGLGINAEAQRTAGGFWTMLVAPVVVTMLLVALWHGAAWTFVLFGMLHAAFLVTNHAWRVVRLPALPKPGAIGLTYLCVLIGAVMFRATTVGDAGAMFAGMAGLHGMGAIHPDAAGIIAVLWLLSLYAIVWFVPSTRQWMQGETAGRIAWKPSPAWAAVLGCAATLGLLAAGGTGEFLYFRF